MTQRRAYTILEALVVCGILCGLVALVLIPQYSKYSRAREVDDAAAVLAQDISFLERFAQNSAPYEGATIEVLQDDPLRYTCYSGRPSHMDPQSYIRGILFERSFPNVALVPGALRRDGPFLFAHNGSVQYVTGSQWADQHVPVVIQLRSRIEDERLSSVQLDPFTGAVSHL